MPQQACFGQSALVSALSASIIGTYCLLASFPASLKLGGPDSQSTHRTKWPFFRRKVANGQRTPCLALALTMELRERGFSTLWGILKTLELGARRTRAADIERMLQPLEAKHYHAMQYPNSCNMYPQVSILRRMPRIYIPKFTVVLRSYLQWGIHRSPPVSNPPLR